MTRMACPACTAQAPTTLVLRVDRHRLVRCAQCAVVRVDPWPERDTLLRQYDRGYFQDANRGYRDYEADRPLLRKEMARRVRAIERLGVGPRWLDVGCASGVLLEVAMDRGLAASGIEPAASAAAVARARSGAPVLSAAIDEAVLPVASQDVISLFDVLEHVPAPWLALRRMRWALAPGGLLAVTVPDFGGWWARASAKHWPLLTPWEHVLHFTRRSLIGLLRRSGFTTCEVLHARTPCSVGTALEKGLGLRLRSGTLAGRGVPLPFGTLFVVARAPR